MNIPITFRLLFFGLMFLSVSVRSQSRSGYVTLNIRLLPVQTIAIQTSQKTTDLVYASTYDYEHGVSVVQDDHLTVFSSSGFQVTVAADESHFIQSEGDEVIAVSDFVIRAAGGSSSGLHTHYEEAILSTNPAPIINSESGGRDLQYTITYDNKIAGSSQKYIDKYVSAGNRETVYTANITYTISTR